jgi:predicted ATP-grasp superfamily ATP-dependent carboligase
LSEGSSLSARQALYALGPTGHVVDVCDPRPFGCLARYSRYVHAVHRCPPFAADPAGYLRFVYERLVAGRYDVFLPVHDQVFLAARFRDELGHHAGLAVPAFATVECLQSKAAFLRVLDELGLPHPPTRLVGTRAELEEAVIGRCYIKLPFSTAGRGVWLLADRTALPPLAEHLEQGGFLSGGHEVLVQEPAPGVLGVAQSVFQHGRLVAVHCYEACAQGVGGSAWARVSASHAAVVGHLDALGEHLAWHGALMLDYLYDHATGRPAYIEANPRLGETVNATLSGTNLAHVLVQVSLGRHVPRLAPSRVGVRTHSVVMSLLAMAQRGAGRGRLLKELGRAWTHLGPYAGGSDELTQPHEDGWSALPAAFLVGRLLLNPRAASGIIGGTVASYALAEAAAAAIRALPPGELGR